MGTAAGGLELQYVSPQKLVPCKDNPRRMDAEGIQKLQRSIERFGFRAPIIAQKGTNMVIAGHKRLKAALEAGLEQVPVIFVEMSDEDAKAYMIADNRLAEESRWDYGLLSSLIEELAAAEVDLDALGFGADELERLLEISAETSFLDDVLTEAEAEAAAEEAAPPPSAAGPAVESSTEPLRVAEPAPPQPPQAAEPATPQPPQAAEPVARSAVPEPITVTGKPDAYVTVVFSMTVQQREDVLRVLNQNKREGESLGTTLWRLLTHGVEQAPS